MTQKLIPLCRPCEPEVFEIRDRASINCRLCGRFFNTISLSYFLEIEYDKETAAHMLRDLRQGRDAMKEKLKEQRKASGKN